MNYDEFDDNGCSPRGHGVFGIGGREAMIVAPLLAIRGSTGPRFGRGDFEIELSRSGGQCSQLLSVARPDRGSAVATSRLSDFKLAAMVVAPPLAIRGST